MREFQEKRKIKRRIYSKTTVIILAIILLLFVEGTWKVYQKDRKSGQNLDRVNSELSSLSARQIALNAEISRLKTDQGTEDEIRSKYDVSKPGEQVLVIVDKEATTTATSTGNSWSHFWSEILSFFGKKS